MSIDEEPKLRLLWQFAAEGVAIFSNNSRLRCFHGIVVGFAGVEEGMHAEHLKNHQCLARGPLSYRLGGWGVHGA